MEINLDNMWQLCVVKAQKLKKVKFENFETFKMEKTKNIFLQQHPFNMRFARKGSYKEYLFRFLEFAMCIYESFFNMTVSFLDN